MKRSVTIGLGVGLVLVAAALWLGLGWLLEPAAPTQATVAPARDEASQASVSGDAVTSLRPAADPLPVPATQGAAKTPGGAPSRQALGSRAEVFVVEQASGRPLPEAGVRAYVPPDPDAHWEATAWELDSIDAWMAAHGEPVEVQPDGVAYLLLPEGGVAVLVGEAAGLWGRALVLADAGERQRLELAPDAGLEVRTVDPRGAPRAGIPVVLRASTGGWSQGLWTKPSGPDGRVTLAHVGLLLSEPRNAATWSVAADVLLGEPAEERLDPGALPREPIVLVVPQTGAVEVTVRALPDGPSAEGGQASLLHVQDGVAVRPTFWSRPRRLVAPIREGRARFEHVGLGLELAVEARGPRSKQPTRRSTRGPSLAGEVRQVELVLGSDHPLLRLRLVGAEGGPLADTAVHAELEQSNVFSTTASRDELRTDPDGVLFYDLAPEWVEGGERTLALTSVATDDEAAGRAQLDLARSFPPGLTDLGDVRVAAAERLAAGRVEDSAGSPLAGARVAVALPQEWAGDTPWFESRSELDATTDEHGAFEVRGPVESTSLRLVATAEGFAADPVVVPVGSTEVVLRLGRVGSVEGRLLVDDLVELEQLAVQLHPVLGREGERGERRSVASIGEDGTFALRGLYPGPYDLVVRARQASEELVSIEGLVVPEGAPCQDPRLLAIDLRGRLCTFTLELVPPRAGMSVSGVVLARPVGASPDAEQSRFFVGEQVAFTVVAPALDLEILAQGFRRVRLEAVRADTRVALEEGPAVRLRLPADVELPTPPRYLKAFVGAEADFWTVGHMQDAVFGESRELVLRVAQPGTLQVLWMLEERSEDTLSTTSLGYEQAQTIEVLDLSSEQVFVVAPDPQTYAAALERWKER